MSGRVRGVRGLALAAMALLVFLAPQVAVAANPTAPAATTAPPAFVPFVPTAKLVTQPAAKFDPKPAIDTSVNLAPSMKQPDVTDLPIHVVKVLRTSNKAQITRYVPKVYDLDQVNPYAVLWWVRRAAQIENGTWYFFAKPDVKDGVIRSGKVVLVLPEYMFPQVDEMIKVIDRPDLTTNSGTVWNYFRPNHRSVSDAGFVNLLNAGRGVTGTTVVDTEVNKFLYYAAASRTAGGLEVLAKADVPPPQVMVEVTVYEINVDNGSRIGLDYVAWKNGPGRNLFAVGAFNQQEKVLSQNGITPLINTGSGGTFGLPGHETSGKGTNAALYLDVPSAFFDFLVVKNKARVMTSAKLAARNQIAASLASQDTILYYKTLVGTATTAGQRPAGLPLDPTGSSSSYPDNRAVTSNQTTRLVGAKTGVSLQFTPLIGSGEINMNVVATVIDQLGFDDKGTPILASRTTDTKIKARDDQEIILGGYTREISVQRSDKMPILGSLPIIGYLFGGESNTTRRTQVVIVLRPHIIPDFAAMTYPQTHINAAAIQAKAEGRAPVNVPKTEFGFDQWLLDSEQ